MSFNDHRARAVREAVFGRENREPIARSCEAMRDIGAKRAQKVDDLHGERVNAASAVPITGQDGYFTLVLTRANGE